MTANHKHYGPRLDEKALFYHHQINAQNCLRQQKYEVPTTRYELGEAKDHNFAQSSKLPTVKFPFPNSKYNPSSLIYPSL